jgi:hypothetical protein
VIEGSLAEECSSCEALELGRGIVEFREVCGPDSKGRANGGGWGRGACAPIFGSGSGRETRDDELMSLPILGIVRGVSLLSVPSDPPESDVASCRQ